MKYSFSVGGSSPKKAGVKLEIVDDVGKEPFYRDTNYTHGLVEYLHVPS